MATSGFGNNQLRRSFSPVPGDLFDPCFVVGKAQSFARRPHGHISSSLANIHPDPGCVHGYFPFACDLALTLAGRIRAARPRHSFELLSSTCGDTKLCSISETYAHSYLPHFPTYKRSQSLSIDWFGSRLIDSDGDSFRMTSPMVNTTLEMKNWRSN